MPNDFDGRFKSCRHGDYPHRLTVAQLQQTFDPRRAMAARCLPPRRKPTRDDYVRLGPLVNERLAANED